MDGLKDIGLHASLIEFPAGEASKNIKTVLEIAGKCSSASEAIEMLRLQTIDLIFLDIHMPEVGGFESRFVSREVDRR